MNIARVHNPNELNLEEINALLVQQSPGETKSIDNDGVTEALRNPLFHLYVATADTPAGRRSVGMATIFFQRNIARYIAEIHDVVVDENYRGHGLGEKLVSTLIDTAQNFAKERDTKIKLYLTSRTSRIAANKLYTKLGFTLAAEATGDWGTNLYKLMVTP